MSTSTEGGTAPSSCDLVYPCLFCNVPLLVDAEEWSKIVAPAAICKQCVYFATPELIKMQYLVRCLIHGLNSRLNNVVNAQQELEAEIFQN